MTFNIITFGCKVNQCESEDIREVMTKENFNFVSGFDSAEVVIINSCTVTGESDRKLRQTIHRVKRINKNCILVLTGCMPQAEPDIAQKIKDIDIIVGNSNKSLIPKMVSEFLYKKNQIFNIEPIKNLIKFENGVVNHSQNRSRAFLKIQDGCNRFCSYCVIPYARGRVRSKSIEQLRNDALMISENGYKEIVLVGINLSSYGFDLGCNLADAVRFGVDGGHAEEGDQPQFHLSLQSGSDKILKIMRRRYNREEYLKVVNKLRSTFKDASITTDIMVGFPGETEEDFNDTIRIIDEAEFLKVHVFPYSPRPNTPAAAMENQISRNTKAERVKKVIEKSDKRSKIVLSGFLENFADVLYETVDDLGFYEGYTPNYISVKTRFPYDVRGKIVKTYLSCVRENFIEGLFK